MSQIQLRVGGLLESFFTKLGEILLLEKLFDLLDAEPSMGNDEPIAQGWHRVLDIIKEAQQQLPKREKHIPYVCHRVEVIKFSNSTHNACHDLHVIPVQTIQARRTIKEKLIFRP